jgi:hypothetical protein
MGRCFSSASAALSDFARELGESSRTAAANRAELPSQPHAASSNPPRTEVAPGVLAGLLSLNAPRRRPAHEVAKGSLGLVRLPPEIIDHIAAYLRREDICDFADTCRALRHTLQQEKRSITLTAQAAQIRTPGEAIGMLIDIQTEIFRPSLRGGPLAALATTIDPTAFVWVSSDPHTNMVPRLTVQNWSGDTRVQVFTSVWKAIAHVPSEDRVEPLSALVSTLRYLPVAERTIKFDTILRQVAELPREHWARLLAALGRQVRYLDLNGQRAMFDAVLGRSRQLPPEEQGLLLGALATNIPYMPESAAKFDTLIDEARQLPATHQYTTFRRLARSIGLLPADRQPAAFERAMRVIEQLPPGQQAVWLKAFTGQIHKLAQAGRVAAFDHALRVTGQLDRPEDQAGQLTELAMQIEHLPDAARTQRFNEVLNATWRLRDDLQAEPDTVLREVAGRAETSMRRG